MSFPTLYEINILGEIIIKLSIFCIYEKKFEY